MSFVAQADVSRRDLIAWAADGKPADIEGRRASAAWTAARIKAGLRDGVVVLRLLMNIFPAAESAMSGHWQADAANRYAINHNWKGIHACAEQLGLPLAAFDRVGISVGRDRALYTLLAVLYFMDQLKRKPRFTASFSFKLSEATQNFLQSNACIICLAKGGAIVSAAYPRIEIRFEHEVPRQLVDKDWLWRYGPGDPELGKRQATSQHVASGTLRQSSQSSQNIKATGEKMWVAEKKSQDHMRPKTRDPKPSLTRATDTNEDIRHKKLLSPLHAELEMLRNERLKQAAELEDVTNKNRKLQELVAVLQRHAAEDSPGQQQVPTVPDDEVATLRSQLLTCETERSELAGRVQDLEKQLADLNTAYKRASNNYTAPEHGVVPHSVAEEPREVAELRERAEALEELLISQRLSQAGSAVWPGEPAWQHDLHTVSEHSQEINARRRHTAKQKAAIGNAIPADDANTNICIDQDKDRLADNARPIVWAAGETHDPSLKRIAQRQRPLPLSGYGAQSSGRQWHRRFRTEPVRLEKDAPIMIALGRPRKSLRVLGIRDTGGFVVSRRSTHVFKGSVYRRRV